MTNPLLEHKKGQLADYSNFRGDLRGNPYIGTLSYLGGWPFTYEIFTESLAKMVDYTKDHIKQPIHWNTVRSSSISYARNIVASQVIGDWVMMLDTDIQFDPDLLVRMLKTFNELNIPVLTGVYLYKKPPHWPVIYTWDEKKKKYQTVKDWITETPQLAPFDIHAAGAGVLIVRKWVFQYIEQELGEKAFDIRKPFDAPRSKDILGEDLSFFDRCRQLDIQVVCDPRITVSHITPYPITPGKDYEPHKVKPELIK